MNDRKPGDRASDAGRTDLYDTTVREAHQRCLEPFEADVARAFPNAECW